jgi:hypothetical protein
MLREDFKDRCRLSRLTCFDSMNGLGKVLRLTFFVRKIK